MRKFIQAVCFYLTASCCSGLETPTTSEAVQEIIERSKQNPEALRELAGAPLDLIMKPLWKLSNIGEHTFNNWKAARQNNDEKEFLEMEAKCGRDPAYLAAVFPIARGIVTSHPDFEWTVGSKLTEMTFILNEGVKNERYAEVNSYYGDQLGIARRAPGDMAFRLLGPCLFSRYYPAQNHGDTTSESPAAHARWALAGLLKERYGEILPEDIEAARAWWKANEHRFAEKESAAPKTQRPAKIAPTPDAKSEPATSLKPQSEDGSPPPPVSHSEPATPSHPRGRTAAIGVFAALLLATALFFFKKH